MKPRHLVLAAMLVASTAAALWLPASEGQVVQPAVRAAAPSRTTPSQPAARPAEPATVLRLAPRAPTAEDAAAPFGVPEWATPKPVAKAPQPAASQAATPPQAPPAPFKVIGRYEEAGQIGVFLEHQQKTMVARAGDQLTAEWKVESVEGARVVLQYLPLSQRQTLEWTSP